MCPKVQEGSTGIFIIWSAKTIIFQFCFWAPWLSHISVGCYSNIFFSRSRRARGDGLWAILAIQKKPEKNLGRRQGGDVMPSGTALSYPPQREMMECWTRQAPLHRLMCSVWKQPRTFYTHMVRLEGAGWLISAETIPFPKRAFKKSIKSRGQRSPGALSHSGSLIGQT